MVVLTPLVKASQGEVALLIRLLTGPAGAHVHRQAWFADDVRNLVRFANPDSHLIRQNGRAAGYVSIAADDASIRWFEIAITPAAGLSACGFQAASLAIACFRRTQPAVPVLRTWIHDANPRSRRSAVKMGWVCIGHEGPWEAFSLEIQGFLRSRLFAAGMARAAGMVRARW